MTPENYVLYIIDEFERGETYVELMTDDPQRLVDSLYYRSRKQDWHFKTTLESVIVMKQKEPKRAQFSNHVCGPDCKRFGFCFREHYEQKRQAHSKDKKYINSGGTVTQARMAGR